MVPKSTVFFGQAASFLMPAHEFFVRNDLARLTARDHICCKCGSADVYDELRAMLEAPALGIFSHQALISDRRVSYIKLVDPILSAVGPISYVELSDRKADEEENDTYGFHHLEIYPVHDTSTRPGDGYDVLCADIKRAGWDIVAQDRPHHPTHDVTLPGGLIIRVARGPLIEKIAAEIVGKSPP
jgi:hypothetical protein